MGDVIINGPQVRGGLYNPAPLENKMLLQETGFA